MMMLSYRRRGVMLMSVRIGLKRSAGRKKEKSSRQLDVFCRSVDISVLLDCTLRPWTLKSENISKIMRQ